VAASSKEKLGTNYEHVKRPAMLLPLLTFCGFLLSNSCSMPYLLLSYLLVDYNVRNSQYYDTALALMVTPAVVAFNVLYVVTLWKAWIDTGNGRLGRRQRWVVLISIPLGLIINCGVSSWVFRNFG
jgi:hypothetical protein